MALALSLPLTFPDREAIINMTFGVVLFTLLVPGLTMEPLVRFLGMAPKEEKLNKYQEYKALMLVYRHELKELATLKEEGKISEPAYEKWKNNLQDKILDASQNVDRLQLSDVSIDDLRDRQSKIHLLEGRKDYIVRLGKEGALTDESARHLKLMVDSELDSVADSHEASSAEEKNSELGKTT